MEKILLVLLLSGSSLTLLASDLSAPKKQATEARLRATSSQICLGADDEDDEDDEENEENDLAAASSIVVNSAHDDAKDVTTALQELNVTGAKDDQAPAADKAKEELKAASDKAKEDDKA